MQPGVQYRVAVRIRDYGYLTMSYFGKAPLNHKFNPRQENLYVGIYYLSATNDNQEFAKICRLFQETF